MKNMKRSESEMEGKPETMACEPSPYPYGLCISLDEESLSKLGVEKLPQIGTKVLLMAKATVESVEARATQEGKYRNMRLQITDLELSDAKPEKSAVETMYGNGD